MAPARDPPSDTLLLLFTLSWCLSVSSTHFSFNSRLVLAAGSCELKSSSSSVAPNLPVAPISLLEQCTFIFSSPPATIDSSSAAFDSRLLLLHLDCLITLYIEAHNLAQWLFSSHSLAATSRSTFPLNSRLEVLLCLCIVGWQSARQPAFPTASGSAYHKPFNSFFVQGALN